MCLILGVEDDVGQVTLHSVNNIVMQSSDAFLLNYNEEIVGGMVLMEYEDVLVDHEAALSGAGGTRSSCKLPSQC